MIDQLLKAFELAQDGRGRRAYVAWLEERATHDAGKVSDAAMKALRRGWHLGEPSFMDQLRELVSKDIKKETGRDGVARSHDEAEAKALAKGALEAQGVDPDQKSLKELRKGDPRKVLVAVLLRERTSVSNRWIVERLAMGHPNALSRLMGDFRSDESKLTSLEEFKAMLG